MNRLVFLMLAAGLLPAQEFDLVIRGARVVDGMGNPWYRADLGVKGDRIAAIGRFGESSAKVVIAAGGLVVTPGFIDMMAGSSVPLLNNAASGTSKILQGITTMMAGEGHSDAPRKGTDGGWRTYGEYFAQLEMKGLALNTVHNVGAAQVRLIVMGEEDRAPTAAEMQQMREHVRQAMRDGAVGLSTALIYPPGTYAKTEELVELAKVAAEFGGFYSTHMRNESSKVLEAIQEAIEIGRQASLPVHIYHLKAAGQENWPLMRKAIDLIAHTRAAGQDVTADIYPYIRNGIGLEFFIHPKRFAAGHEALVKSLADAKVRAELRREIETTSDWENWYRHVGRNWDNVLVANVPEGQDKRFEGKSVAEIAKLRGKDEWTTFFDLVQSGRISVNPKSMDEEQKRMALRTEFISVDTDSDPLDPATTTNAHPRGFGAFPRVLAQYVRAEKVISLEAAVRQMSSLAANRLRLYDRGRIAPGMAADLLIFDPEKIQDTATFTKPVQIPTGLDWVIVNGRIAGDHGKWTGALAGKVLRNAHP